MRVAERGITSPKSSSCWRAARDGAPREATFRNERLVVGEEDGPGSGTARDAGPRCRLRRGHGGMPSVMNPLLEACVHRNGEHGAGVAR